MKKALLPPLLIALLALSALSGCDRQPPSHSTTANAFGQPLTLTLLSDDEALAGAASASAVEDLLFIAEVSHPWKPGPLGRTNQLFGFEAEFSANPSILPMIIESTRLEQATAGYYSPSLGKLQQLWGFHSELPSGPLPEAEEVQAVLDAAPSMQAINIDGIRMRSDNAALRIDFGRFAQGYALDTARARLQEHGIDLARVDNTNAVAVLGDGWYTSLADGSRLQLLEGEAALTLSAEDEGYYQQERLIHPYLDPTNGFPSDGLQAVTVIHRSAASAAALAHALLSGGEAKLAEQLNVLPVEYAIAVTTDGRQITTPALARRMQSAP